MTWRKHDMLIVGTDTEIGKTVISALVLTRYASTAPRYWKPVASGSDEGRDVEEVERLTAGRIEVLPETYLLRQPLSPHLAARLDGVTIDLQHLTEEWHRLRQDDRPLIVEGIGGLLVPLTEEGDLLIDLFANWGPPCLLVARSALGTINHTLLSLEALRRRNVPLAGVVLSGPPNAENRLAIERYGAVDVVGELPWLAPLDAASLEHAARRFDPAASLARYLCPETPGPA